VAAGKGTKYLPEYHYSTPDTVFTHYGFSEKQVAEGDFNARMFNSFLDGTKSAIEMSAIANATGLVPQPDGLKFPPAGVDDLAETLKPIEDGGVLLHSGTVEVVSSLCRDGSPVERDLRWGVYVTFKAATEYARRCFLEYGIPTDSSGVYSALYRPCHLIGMELGVSVASVALRGQPTGTSHQFLADVCTVAKANLDAGTVLDGEGGYTVYGKVLPAETSLDGNMFPLGLASGVKLASPVVKDQVIRYHDVDLDPTEPLVELRRQLENRSETG
jgi:predicted homoserine dehydrogenase-like protein